MADIVDPKSDSFHSWNRAISAIMANLHDESLPAHLLEALRTIVPIDIIIIEILCRNNKTVIHYDNVEQERHKIIIEDYLNGPYLLNPFYQAFMDNVQPGGYLLEELAPDDFLNSEYFKQYYHASDGGSEFGYLFSVTPEIGVCIGISRSTWNPDFSAEEVNKLRAMEPVVRTSFLSYWEAIKGLDTSDQTSTSDLHQQIASAVENFGTSVLTARECQIAQLILRGHSSKSTAEKLDITAATVNTHRHKIYEKLDVTSQAELFSVFIDALSCSGESNFFDPLEAYHKLK